MALAELFLPNLQAYEMTAELLGNCTGAKDSSSENMPSTLEFSASSSVSVNHLARRAECPQKTTATSFVQTAKSRLIPTCSLHRQGMSRVPHSIKLRFLESRWLKSCLGERKRQLSTHS